MRADELPEPAVPSPPPGLVTVGRFDQRSGYSVNRPSGADSWLFTWTTGGEGRLVQGTAETPAGAGDLVVLGPERAPPLRGRAGRSALAFWWVHCQARPTWTDWLRPYALGRRTYAVRPIPAVARGRLGVGLPADARGRPVDGGGGTARRREPEDGRVAVAHGTAARELTVCSLEEVVLLATAAARDGRDRSGIDIRIRQAEALHRGRPRRPAHRRSRWPRACRSRRPGSRTSSPSSSAVPRCGRC